MDPTFDIVPIFENITGEDIINWFFKAFAILLSVIYLLYALIVYRQTQIMNRTVTRRSGPLLLFVSLLQIFFALGLIFLSITLL